MMDMLTADAGVTVLRGVSVTLGLLVIVYTSVRAARPGGWRTTRAATGWATGALMVLVALYAAPLARWMAPGLDAAAAWLTDHPGTETVIAVALPILAAVWFFFIEPDRRRRARAAQRDKQHGTRPV